MALDYKLMGARIKKARKEKGYTQEKLAEMLDISVPYLSKIETGKVHVNLKRLDQICGLLGVTNSSIIDGTSNNSADYLNSEFSTILKDCPSDDKELFYDIVTAISKKREKK